MDRHDFDGTLWATESRLELMIRLWKVTQLHGAHPIIRDECNTCRMKWPCPTLATARGETLA